MVNDLIRNLLYLLWENAINDFCYSAQQNQWIDKNIQMAVLTDLKMKNHNIICRPLN